MFKPPNARAWECSSLRMYPHIKYYRTYSTLHHFELIHVIFFGASSLRLAPTRTVWFLLLRGLVLSHFGIGSYLVRRSPCWGRHRSKHRGGSYNNTLSSARRILQMSPRDFVRRQHLDSTGFPLVGDGVGMHISLPKPQLPPGTQCTCNSVSEDNVSGVCSAGPNWLGGGHPADTRPCQLGRSEACYTGGIFSKNPYNLNVILVRCAFAFSHVISRKNSVAVSYA